MVELNVQPDHVHMMIRIPPKYSVSEVMGYIKGKSAIHLARTGTVNLSDFGSFGERRCAGKSLIHGRAEQCCPARST